MWTEVALPVQINLYALLLHFRPLAERLHSPESRLSALGSGGRRFALCTYVPSW